MVIRILGSTAILLGLNELGLDPGEREKVERIARRKYGLILVTGPTGSGKTTTLYTLLSLLNSIDRNIITIEDPVEYKLDGISQVQVDRNIGLEFANGLRASLRQDPDIIMVGEIRDPETARIAVRASLTGHVVFSTLHTNNSLGAISTLRYMGVQSYLIASSMSLVIAQRLVRRNCNDCTAPIEVDLSVLRDLGFHDDYRANFMSGTGCKACYHTGFRGRTGVYEVLEIEEHLRRAIIEERDELYLRDVAFDNGFRTLQQACAHRVERGVIAPEEGLRECFLLA
jgi:type II secretory ATPase GspE/PulE/Tfp pilus assembly ATPase PilB-like protein